MVPRVGFFQEYHAEKIMDSLRQLSSPMALVIRNGENKTIFASEIVPGEPFIRFRDAIILYVLIFNVSKVISL